MNDTNRVICEETVRRLDDYLDRELNESEMAAVREHLKACELCADGFAFEDTVLHQIKNKLQQAALPKDLKAKVFERLRAMEAENPDP